MPEVQSVPMNVSADAPIQSKVAEGASPASEVNSAVLTNLDALVNLEASDEARLAAATALSSVSYSSVALVAGKLNAMADHKDKVARGVAFSAIAALAQNGGAVFEPILMELFPKALAALADKQNNVRAEAEKAVAALTEMVPANAVGALIPMIMADVLAYKWQTKNAALVLVAKLAARAPAQISAFLPELVPQLTNALSDTKPSIVETALAALSAACSVVQNRDVVPFVPALVACMANPSEVEDTVHKIAATTFVQAVEAPTLSVLVPVLERALKEGSTACKRKCVMIIDNMAKLVENATEAVVFLPKLLPKVADAAEHIPDPEARTVADRALATLRRIEKEAAAVAVLTFADKADALAKVLAAQMEAAGHAADPHALAYAGSLAATVAGARIADTEWAAALAPFMAAAFGASAEEAQAAAKAARLAAAPEETTEGDEFRAEDGEELCNCEFSLAYGSKLLLNTAKLQLQRGRRYGLVGQNGCGKSTLMRSIALGQVDGFPPADKLRTVYVETDIPSELSDLSAVNFVLRDPMLHDVDPALVDKTLAEFGFTDVMRANPVSNLSGGWRMKLALTRAMLKNADILLLDEPTNHLDVANVAWVENYLVSLEKVTSIVVSHDSSCLDKVCTDIIHFDRFKLRRYRGNLTEFVKVVPEAKSYFELKSSTMKFTFPEPGYLEGVKSKGRAILKMHNVGFTYPGTEKKILQGVSIQCSMASRCAVVGPNGAGKSTMIKLLTGELVPDTGDVWKHPNLTVAYVAQHAFHHIEQHLEKTPNEYIRWRYANGEDKESLVKITNVVSAEEEAKMAEKVVVDGEKRQVERILGRQQAKKGYKYEVKWVGKANEFNTWMAREKLEEMGWTKELKRIDDRATALSNGLQKTLSQPVVEKHIADLGLEPEFATHCRMDALSTSQKVKVVLAAAMWQNPHIVILDEPTNYLDREALGALADAIRTFGGGVVMISHHTEFTEALCPETWSMSGGRLTPFGSSTEGQEEVKIEQEQKDSYVDSHGNVVKVKAAKKKMSRKELKEYQRRRAAKIANGQEVSSEEED